MAGDDDVDDEPSPQTDRRDGLLRRRRRERFWRRRPFTAALMAVAAILGIASCLNRGWRADVVQAVPPSVSTTLGDDLLQVDVALVNLGSADAVVVAVAEVDGLVLDAAGVTLLPTNGSAVDAPLPAVADLPATVPAGATGRLTMRWSVDPCMPFADQPRGSDLEITVLDRRGSEQLVLVGVDPLGALAELADQETARSC